MTHLAPLALPAAAPYDDHGYAELLAKITRSAALRARATRISAFAAASGCV
jgi:hypothetical protein